MQLSSFDFNKLPFSELFKTYVGDFEQLSSFYATDPFDEDAIKKHASAVRFPGDRQEAAVILKSFNQSLDADGAGLNNIDRLADENALAVVTGQQLGIYGGPVYTMFKTLTTIHLARRLERMLGRPVIPVFWLADEDHDYEEIRRLHILNGEGVSSVGLPPRNGSLPPVSELEIPPRIEQLREDVRATLIDTDFSAGVWELMDQCFRPGATFADGFGRFMARLFSKHGLVLAGSNNPEIKAFTKDRLITAIRKADALRESLEEQSQKIGEKYHRQAAIYDSHLFFLHPERGRIKIERDDAGGEPAWRTEGGREWTSEALMNEIEASPERFSPDVFLRPLLQDGLLPTVGYVAGPGEIAYYGQMKTFYRCFGQSMPVIFPRMSATFLEPAIERILGELPFELDEYSNRIEDLETAFVDRTEQVDIEPIFEKWKQQADQIAEDPIATITSVDDTLQGAAEKAQASYFNELDRLKGKVYRAVKKREQIQLDRIDRIQQNIFPGRTLQERTLGGIYYMNKFGLDIWDRLLASMNAGLSLNSHTIIKL